ncbi:MAG: hypothetical protein BWY85_00624 [Firmicutes bacterium ADurb.Bin506]|nr:MAG: hypothetical protein BWY85_00624 [Firmicutes bacterium ADurb.Bin506]
MAVSKRLKDFEPWMSYANMRKSDRDDSVMDAANELEFADG